LVAIFISTLAGILLDFDPSGAKFGLSDHEWNNLPKNILVGPSAAIRQQPDPPLPGISAGPPPVLLVRALNAADINIENVQLNYHTVAVNRETTANLLCMKYIAILQYVKSGFLSRAFAIDQEAHAYSFETEQRIYQIELLSH